MKIPESTLARVRAGRGIGTPSQQSNPNSSSFPGTVVTDLVLPPASDLYATTLTATITNTETTIAVAALPANFPVIISIGGEEILCASATGLVLNVTTRGFNGTSPAAHSAGTPVYGNVVSYYINQLSAEVKAIEQDAFNRAFSVLSTGAKGDGVTDDSAAFAAAIASGKKFIRIPAINGVATTYLIGATLAINSPSITIIGDGANLVTLKFGNSITNMFLVLADDFSISGVAIDGNYKASSAAYQIGIWATSIKNIYIHDMRFRYLGYPAAPNYDSIGYGNTHSILLDQCTYFNIILCHHHTNYSVDVQITSCTQGMIRDNQMGTSLLTDAGTATNNWDTHAPAPGGYYISGSKGVQFLNNKIYGGMRFYDTWGKGGPIRFVNCTAILASENFITGKTIGFGTLNCVNGSANVTGVNTSFSTLTAGFTNADDQNIIEIENGGEYKISTVGSMTSVTLTRAFTGATANGLRYRICTSGDLLGASPVFDSVIANNVLQYSGDMGLSLGSVSGNSAFSNNVIADNVVSFCRINGMVLSEGALYNLFANNLFHNNHQGTNTLADGTRGAIGILPTSGSFVGYNTFIGNSGIDDQGVTTQLYMYDVDTANVGLMVNNIQVTGTLANTALTNLSATNFSNAFNQRMPVGLLQFSGTNSTAGGSAALGANSPATVLTAPYTWVRVITSDGTSGWMPIWK